MHTAFPPSPFPSNVGLQPAPSVLVRMWKKAKKRQDKIVRQTGMERDTVKKKMNCCLSLEFRPQFRNASSTETHRVVRCDLNFYHFFTVNCSQITPRQICGVVVQGELPQREHILLVEHISMSVFIIMFHCLLPWQIFLVRNFATEPRRSSHIHWDAAMWANPLEASSSHLKWHGELV